MMKNYNHTAPKKIRIISGKWRRRYLTVTDSPGLRPTTDYAREMLFNWLSPHIVNTNCLDCFAGSGALGIEALSRYASSVTLLEVVQKVFVFLYKNLAVLKAVNANIVNINALTYLAKFGRPYDIIFVDPPFYNGFITKTLHLLERNNWLTNGSLIYVESETENDSFLSHMSIYWNLYREKISNRVAYRLFQYKIV